MMTHPYLVQLHPAVRLQSESNDLVLACADGRGLRSHQSGPAIRTLLNGLVEGGQTLEQLVEGAMASEAQTDLSRLYFLLATLANKGFLNYTVAMEGQRLVTLEPIAPAFRLVDVVDQGGFRLSRFACLRREGETMVVESPLGQARLLLHDARLGALIATLAGPRSLADLVAILPSYPLPLLAATMALLVNAGVAFPCDGAGRIAREADPALRLWEFHDLFFHTRSRAGRHAQPLGGTFRFKNELPPAPALKSPMSTDRIVLSRPVAAIEDPAFFAVLAARSSRRERGASPITVSQLAEFLWYSARVQTQVPAVSNQPETYEYTLRPYPSSGATYDLELYLAVTRCAGLAPGFYHYDPLAHELERLADLGERQQRLVWQAQQASAMPHPPDVLLTLATRFGRVAWKYEGIAYALVLKNVGCLYQQMYLVATALGLAPCALGGGNADQFAEATGLDYYAETSVGEFMLSSRVE